MSARASTWMPFYVGDYLRDTGRLTTEGHGAYLLLILDYWASGGPLPDDDEQLAAVARLTAERWQKLKQLLAVYFTVADGVWRHKRIDQELERAAAIAKSRQEAGKRGGKRSAIARTETKPQQTSSNTEAIASANEQQSTKQNPTPSPSQSHIEEREERVEVAPAALAPQSSPVIAEQSVAQPRPTSPMALSGDLDIPRAFNRSRGTRLPVDWTPPQEYLDWAASERPDIDGAAVGLVFRDYWIAQPGQKGVKTDWFATWRNWVRKEGGGPRTGRSRTMQALDEIERRFDAGEIH